MSRPPSPPSPSLLLPLLLPLLLLAAAARGAAGAGGADMCVLFLAQNVRNFHLGRVAFDQKALLDLIELPATLTQAGGGVAAGADEGQFYIPLQGTTSLIDVNILKNTTSLKAVSPPKGYSGFFAFYTMQLNDAVGDLWALLSAYPTWFAAATVFPNNGTSSALTANFAPSIASKFDWIKVGVATVDTKRGLFVFVAGVGASDVESLVSVKAGDPSAPVQFIEVPGPANNSSDIDFLGYSAPLDLFVASTFWIKTNIAAIQVMAADGKGGAAWETIYSWKVDAELDFELGNAALSKDGKTFFVALDNGKSRAPQYFEFDLVAKKLVSSFVVSASQWPELITAEVVAC